MGSPAGGQGQDAGVCLHLRVPQGSWAEAELAPLAISPAELRRRFGKTEWADRPLLRAFPLRWEAGGPRAKAAQAPLEARAIRRAVIGRLLAGGVPQGEVATWVGHSLAVQRGVYRDCCPPTPAEMALAMRLSAN